MEKEVTDLICIKDNEWIDVETIKPVKKQNILLRYDGFWGIVLSAIVTAIIGISVLHYYESKINPYNIPYGGKNFVE